MSQKPHFMIKERKFNLNFFVKKKNNSVSTAMKKLKKDKLILMILMKYQKDWKKEMKKLWRKNTDLKSARLCQIDFIKRCQKELENITDGVLCDFFRIMTKTQHLPPKNLIIFLMKIFVSLIAGESGCGKTNTLMHILRQPLVYS